MDSGTLGGPTPIRPVSRSGPGNAANVEDAAVALVDEAELPRFIQRRFTIGY